jgi:hypothetical protein
MAHRLGHSKKLSHYDRYRRLDHHRRPPPHLHGDRVMGRSKNRRQCGKLFPRRARYALVFPSHQPPAAEARSLCYARSLRLRKRVGGPSEPKSQRSAAPDPRPGRSLSLAIPKAVKRSIKLIDEICKFFHPFPCYAH